MASNSSSCLQNLMPKDACFLQYVMQQAGECSEKTFFQAHFVGTTYAIVAVAMAILNSVVYLSKGVVYCAVHVSILNGKKAIAIGTESLDGFVRSVLFAVLGIGYIVGGFFFPRLVFLPSKISLDQSTNETQDQTNADQVESNSASMPSPFPVPPESKSSSPIQDELLNFSILEKSTPASSSPIVSEPEPRISPSASRTSSPTPSESSGESTPEKVSYSAATSVPSFSFKASENQSTLSPVPVFVSTTLKISQKPSPHCPAGPPLVAPTPVLFFNIPPTPILPVPGPVPSLLSVTPLTSPIASSSLCDSFCVLPPEAVRELPKGDMVSYVNRYSPTYANRFERLIEEGKNFVFLVKENKESTIPKEKRRVYMAPFVWYLTFLAQIKQGKGFKEGMFVFEDPGHHIHNFFAECATERKSSHFRTTRLSSYGMDIVQDGQTGLPAGHQTAHFGKLRRLDLTKQYTFLKPEAWGTESMGQMAGHAVDYIATRPQHLFHLAPKDGECKEHIPPELSKEFSTLCTKIQLQDYNRSLTLDHGISAMKRILGDYLKLHSDSSFKQPVSEFLAKLESHHPIQNGNEVVLQDIFS